MSRLRSRAGYWLSWSHRRSRSSRRRTRRGGTKQGEVESEGEKLKNNHTWMECGWNEKTSANGLEPCGVMNEFRRLNYGLRAVCSILQFVQVYVRRVMHVFRYHEVLYLHFQCRCGLSSPYHVAATYHCGQPGSSSFASHWSFLPRRLDGTTARC